jgi:hypothetical protein
MQSRPRAASTETVAEPKAKRVLLEALRGRGGKLTKADAVTLSGLPEPQAERALSVLLKEYRSHLSATESGELVYQFDPAFQRRGALTWRERLAGVGAVLWTGFTFLFKISIVVTLVVYFALFVAMLLALIFARRSDDDDDRGFGFGLGDLFWIWGWNPGIAGAPVHRRLSGRPRKPFYKSVFDFVFGPARPKQDALGDEKEILAAIRARKGRIGAVDLVQLMGWDFERAEEEVTRLLVDYGGEPEVTEDGVVVYAFRDLRKTAAEGEGADRAIDRASNRLDTVRPRAAWERLEQSPPLTGNTSSTNTAIGFFNAFNLTAPFWIVPLFEMKTHVSLAAASVWLHDFPAAFSAVFFAVPLARLVREKLRLRARARRNARRSLLQRIFAAPGQPRTAEAIAPEPALAQALQRDLVQLGGDVAPEPDEQGRVRYHFPRIERELVALSRERAKAAAEEKNPGAIVFSSEN